MTEEKDINSIDPGPNLDDVAGEDRFLYIFAAAFILLIFGGVLAAARWYLEAMFGLIPGPGTGLHYKEGFLVAIPVAAVTTGSFILITNTAAASQRIAMMLGFGLLVAAISVSVALIL